MACRYHQATGGQKSSRQCVAIVWADTPNDAATLKCGEDTYFHYSSNYGIQQALARAMHGHSHIPSCNKQFVVLPDRKCTCK